MVSREVEERSSQCGGHGVAAGRQEDQCLLPDDAVASLVCFAGQRLGDKGEEVGLRVRIQGEAGPHHFLDQARGPLPRRIKYVVKNHIRVDLVEGRKVVRDVADEEADRQCPGEEAVLLARLGREVIPQRQLGNDVDCEVGRLRRHVQGLLGRLGDQLEEHVHLGQEGGFELPERPLGKGLPDDPPLQTVKVSVERVEHAVDSVPGEELVRERLGHAVIVLVDSCGCRPSAFQYGLKSWASRYLPLKAVVVLNSSLFGAILTTGPPLYQYNSLVDKSFQGPQQTVLLMEVPDLQGEASPGSEDASVQISQFG